MKSENFNKTIERLSSLNNESRNTYKSIGSCVLLFKEFCRRMALWSDTMFLKDHWPLFDITSNIDSSWEIDYNQLSDYLKEKNITIFSPTSNQIIKWFIHWEGNKNKELIKQFNLPDPYEPVITLLQRGGDIHKEGGFFEILSARLPTLTWEEYFSETPFTSLDSKELDEFDRIFNEKRNT